MPFLHAQVMREFLWGDDVVLLAMDTAGAAVVGAALAEATARGSSHVENDGVTHLFELQREGVDIEISDDGVMWRVDRAAAVEIVERLAVFGKGAESGHHYVDIRNPAATLVLSCGEYSPQFFERFA